MFVHLHQRHVPHDVGVYEPFVLCDCSVSEEDVLHVIIAALEVKVEIPNKIGKEFYRSFLIAKERFVSGENIANLAVVFVANVSVLS